MLNDEWNRNRCEFSNGSSRTKAGPATLQTWKNSWKRSLNRLGWKTTALMRSYGCSWQEYLLTGPREPLSVLTPATSGRPLDSIAVTVDLWRSNRTVQAKEVESLLKALEENLPDDTAMPTHGTTDRPVWHLERVEIHRFGGLHRHVGPNGEDPEDFVVEFDKEITLVSGFNGAGKTALLSAIIWCLTGKALRSQHMPQQIHEPMAVKWTGADEQESKGEDIRPEIAVPPLVPVPAAEDLVKLGDKPKLDTGVRLTLRREDTGEIHRVARQLKVLGTKLVAPVEGLDALGLSALAIEVGTLMPGVGGADAF